MRALEAGCLAGLLRVVISVVTVMAPEPGAWLLARRVGAGASFANMDEGAVNDDRCEAEAGASFADIDEGPVSEDRCEAVPVDRSEVGGEDEVLNDPAIALLQVLLQIV